jgi:spermidine/putrescine transport system permease protein
VNVFRHNRGTRWLLYGVTAGLYLFIFTPIAVVIYGSFDPNEVLSFPYAGASLRWYREFFASRGLLTAIRNSVFLGLAASAGAVVFGLLAAIVVVRFRFPGQQALQLVLVSPMVVSKVILGAAVLSFMAALEIPRGWGGLILLHALVTLPFAFLVLWARLVTLGRMYEEAALVLGADELAATWEVTLPLLAPAVVGAALLGFTVSFDEFSATQFLTTSRTATVPIRVYSMIETAITPTVNVLATFLILVTGLLPALAQSVFGVLRRGRLDS